MSEFPSPVLLSEHNFPSVESFRETDQTPIIGVDVPRAKGELLRQETRSFDLVAAELFAGTVKEGSNAEQDLVGAALIDEDNPIGLVRVRIDGETHLALSRMKKSTAQTGDRAEMLGIVRAGGSIELGRNDINPGDSMISRAHLKISLSKEGKVTFSDTSTNGTEFITFESQVSADKSIPTRGIGRYLKRRQKDGSDSQRTESETTAISDFITDIKGWSIKTSIVEKALKPKQPDEAIWDYTVMPDQLMPFRGSLKGYEEPYVDEQGAEMPARFEGRTVISRDSKINEGVYIVPGIQEAIVVDDNRKRKPGDNWKPENLRYAAAFSNFKLRAKAEGVQVEHAVKEEQVLSVLKSAFESAMDQLEYDLEYSENMARNFSDKKINLDVLLKDGKGVCRHQALLTAYHIERLIDGGYMKGSISVDRNRIPGKGGHAWARYTSPDGEVYIMDPAQNFFGTLKESRTKAQWNYARDTDQL